MTADAHILLDPAAYVRIPWKNGGGVSVTIAGERRDGAAPGDWSGVIWQLGRTSIVTPAPFSDLSGFVRFQTVIAGRGLYLDTPDGAIDLAAPLHVACYDGGTPIVSRLTEGPVDVVNLIVRRDCMRANMIVQREGQSARLGAGSHIIHASIGAARVAIEGVPFSLGADAALQLSAPGAVSVMAGTVIIASIARL